ncbi:MAG: TetR/AcrR family transcriptional regulator [Deltaproteobacteria bacterium]
MGRPRTAAHAVATSERLLQAAEDAFAEHGYDGARLEDIAKSAGIRRSSLLYHYGSKHALFCAVVRHVFADLEQALEHSLSFDEPFPDQVERVLEAFFDFVRRRPGVARLILREILDDKGPGQSLLLDGGVPLLELVERFVEERGEGFVPPGLSVRAALLQIVSGTFVKASAGPLQAKLWNGEDHQKELARSLFLRRTG